MQTIIQGPPLDIETKSAFVEEEKKVGEEGNFFRKLLLGMKREPHTMVKSI